MANEFHYSVSLSILHKSIDPKLITAVIPELEPRIEAMAGNDRRDREGNIIMPARKTMYSHWLADLHSEKRLFSGDIEFSDFILKRLQELEHHCDFFHELATDGNVTLSVAWYSVDNCSAALLDAAVLKKSGELGINIELNVYFLAPTAQPMILNATPLRAMAPGVQPSPQA